MRAIALIKSIALFGLGAATAGCRSQASVICELICECERCDEQETEIACITLEADEDVAETYGCEEEWETFATCLEEKGQCDEKEAVFSTSTPGNCGGTQPLGTPCVIDDDCMLFGVFCDAGTCVQRTCVPDGSICQSNIDCPGEVRCDDESDALRECIQDSSTHDGPIPDLD